MKGFKTAGEIAIRANRVKIEKAKNLLIKAFYLLGEVTEGALTPQLRNELAEIEKILENTKNVVNGILKKS